LDVYDAIPTIVTSFVAIIAKISIFILLLQLVYYINNNFLEKSWTFGAVSGFILIVLTTLQCLKLSNSGNTLKLLVPNFLGNSVSGWINHSCKVINHKILERVMGNRGSKSGWLFTNHPVKEQRIDGSWYIIIIELRYILTGFERNYPILYIVFNENKLIKGSFLMLNLFIIKVSFIRPLFYLIIPNEKEKFNPFLSLKNFNLGFLQDLFNAVLSLLLLFEYLISVLEKNKPCAALYKINNYLVFTFKSEGRKVKFYIDCINPVVYTSSSQLALLNKFSKQIYKGYGLKLHFKSYYSTSAKQVTKEAIPGACLPSGLSLENFKWWFVGFSDGESCFYILSKKDLQGNIKSFSFKFKIELHLDDSKVLNMVHETLKLGLKVSQSTKKK